MTQPPQETATADHLREVFVNALHQPGILDAVDVAEQEVNIDRGVLLRGSIVPGRLGYLCMTAFGPGQLELTNPTRDQHGEGTSCVSIRALGGTVETRLLVNQISRPTFVFDQSMSLAAPEVEIGGDRLLQRMSFTRPTGSSLGGREILRNAGGQVDFAAIAVDRANAWALAVAAGRAMGLTGDALSIYLATVGDSLPEPPKPVPQNRWRIGRRVIVD